jgi:hypothetical protein
MKVESIRGISCDDIRFGLTTVQPNRALKKCRIRKLWVEYYLVSDMAVVLVIPKSCSVCKKTEECTDDFILQIVEKTDESKKSSDIDFLVR